MSFKNHPHRRCTFLIIPVGDFSKSEVEPALKCGYQAVHMSEFRLRTEIAALSAVFSLNN